MVQTVVFQFTHPVWGATAPAVRLKLATDVSIHAPRVGCDYLRHLALTEDLPFQFTHPVWGATGVLYEVSSLVGFQFTHPVWGATAMPKGTH